MPQLDRLLSESKGIVMQVRIKVPISLTICVVMFATVFVVAGLLQNLQLKLVKIENKLEGGEKE